MMVLVRERSVSINGIGNGQTVEAIRFLLYSVGSQPRAVHALRIQIDRDRPAPKRQTICVNPLVKET
jgi:hypothetical protein